MDNIARTRLKEAGEWLDNYDIPKGQKFEFKGINHVTRDIEMFSRDVVLEAYAAGRAIGYSQPEAFARRRSAAMLIYECRDLFKQYAQHHTDKLAAYDCGFVVPDAAVVAEIRAKIDRNQAMVDKCMRWLERVPETEAIQPSTAVALPEFDLPLHMDMRIDVDGDGNVSVRIGTVAGDRHSVAPDPLERGSVYYLPAGTDLVGCRSCAESIETRVGPCDECGAVDGVECETDGSDVNPELLAEACLQTSVLHAILQEVRAIGNALNNSGVMEIGDASPIDDAIREMFKRAEEGQTFFEYQGGAAASAVGEQVSRFDEMVAAIVERDEEIVPIDEATAALRKIEAETRGFVYWPGGDQAPEDWDGGDVLLDWHKPAQFLGDERFTIMPADEMADEVNAWSHNLNPEDYAYIIGYKRNQPDAAAPSIQLSTPDPRFDPKGAVVVNGHLFVATKQ